MRNQLLKFLLICCGFFATPVYAAPFEVTADDQTVDVDDDFVFTEVISSYANTVIAVDTTLSANGIIASGVTTPAISIEDSGSLSSLTIDSGKVSSNNTDSAGGTISLIGDSDTSPIINIGKNSGTSGAIENRVSGNAIYAESVNTNLTINNKATGTISSVGTAINLLDGDNLSTLTLTNAGNISASDYAIYLDGYSGDITNSGNIAGSIVSVSNSTLSITNNSGEISGDIDLGNNISSIINLNGGKISGNVTMRDDGQLFIFNGGNLDGSSIDGYSGSGTSAGTVRVDVDTTLDGFIGQNNPVSLLEISDGVSFDFNGNSSSVSKISIGAATLNDTYGDINTDEIDGSSADVGIFNLGFLDIGEAEITTLIGTDNGLEQFNINGNLSDNPEGTTIITFNQSIKAATTKIEGVGTALRMAAGNVINGDVEIGNAAKLQLNDTSSVSGTIQGVARYEGTLEIYNPRSDGAVSAVTLQSNVGGGSKDLASMIGDYATIIDASTNNVAINAQNIFLYSLSNLQLGSGTVTGNIRGFVDSGSSNGSGSVTFNENNTLGGNVGTSTGNALNNVEINTNISVAAGSYEINATNININAGSSLSTSSLISGGDNDDSGASLKDSIITMQGGATLTLDSGSSIYASINSSDIDTSLIINSSLDSSNSHLNIGSSGALGSIELHNSTLDVSGNNGAVKASAILMDNGSTLKIGNAEIIGTVNGYSNDDTGTLDIQGYATLGGNIGNTFSLHLVNIGTDGEDGFTVTAAESITASDVTLNGDGTILNLGGGKSLTGNLTLGNGTEFSVGDDATVNGSIKGSAQYNGTLKIGAGNNFAASGNIGASSLDLSEIKIHGTFDLSGLSAYTAHAQTFSLTAGASFTIGLGAVEGDIKGTAADGGATDGAGKGSVNFAANNNSFSGAIGTTDGHAIYELNIANSITVDSGSADINAARITLYDNSSLTSSASLISGGNNNSDTGLIGTTVTLNSGSSLTLNNVDLFLGSIDGNDDGEGSLTLNGTYGNDLNPDNINIGATKKLAALTLTTSTTLDVSTFNGIIKADTITLNNNSVLTLGNGDVAGTIDGFTTSLGTVNIVNSTTLGSAVYLGGMNGLLAVNFGNNVSETSFDVTNSISALTTNLTANTLNLGDDATISGDVVLNGNSILTLGNSSAVNGTITNTSTSDASGGLRIREDATVTTHGNIGGGGFNFYEVALSDNSNLDLSTNNNSITSRLVTISGGATLSIGNASVNAEIQAHNSLGGSNYGLGRVVFADDNTLGGNVGASTGATLERVTINATKTINAGSYEINALDIILNDGAILNSAALISGGPADEGAPLSDSTISLGDGAALQLSNGASVVGTIDGNANNHGQLKILSGNIEAQANIGNNFNLEYVGVASGSSFDLSANNVILKATNIYLEDNTTLTIGTNSVTGNILGYAASGSSNGLGNVVFAGATNSLAGNVGGHNDNALESVMINAANSVTTGSHEINASTITLGNYSTLTVGGAISGGADITGATPIATAITLNENAALILNSGAAIFGTIDGDSDNHGTIEVASNYTTNGNIGSTFKLASVIVNDNVDLNLGTNSNSLNASTLYLGTNSTLTLGDAGTVSAAVSSLSSDSGVVYLDNSVTLDSGSTFGGDTGLLSIYIDHAANGNVVIDSHDSIKSRNVNIEGFRSTLNLSANKTITGNVNLGDGSRLNLADGSTVVGTIDSINDSGGALRISGSVTSQGNIGNAHILGSVTLNAGAALYLSTNDNSLNSDSVTLGSGSNLVVGSGSIVGTFIGASDGDSTITFTKNNAIDAGTFIGDSGTSNHVGDVVVSSGTLRLNEDMYVNRVAVDGVLIAGADKGIDGDTVTISGTVVVNDNSFINAAIQGSSGVGSFVLYDDANFTSTNILGGADDLQLATVALRYGSTLNLQTNNNSVNAASILLFNDSTLNIGTSTVSGTITGLSNGKGSVNFYGDNNLGGDLGVSGNAVHDVTINSGNIVDTQGHEIHATGDVTLASNAELISSSQIAASLLMNNNSTLTLGDGASVVGAINAASANSSGLGRVDVSGTVTLNGSIGDVHKINNLTIEDGATLSTSADSGIINAAAIAVGIGSTLSMSNTLASAGDFGLHGVVDGAGSVNLSATSDYNFGISNYNTFNLTATLGSSDTLSSVNFNLTASYLSIDNSIKADTVNVSGLNGYLILAANKNISGDVVLNSGGALNLKNQSTVSGTITTFEDGRGVVIVGSNISAPGGAASTVVAQDDIGDNITKLGVVALSDNTTLDLATHATNIYSNGVYLGSNSILQIGNGSVTAADAFAMSSDSTVTIGGGSLTAGVVMSAGNSITIADGAIYGTVRGAGDVTFTDDNMLHGTMGITSSNNAQLNSLTINSGLTLTSDYEIAASSIDVDDNSTLTTSAKISGGFDGTNTLASEITLGSNSFLQLNGSSSVTANINGSADDNGELDIFGDIAGNINIGDSAKLHALTIDTSSSLDVSANDNSINSTNITLASSAILTIGTTTFNSAIDGGNDDYGTLNIASGKTATSNGNIGASHYLNAININEGATLDLATNTNSLAATTITFANNAVLNIDSGAISGNFVGASDGNGTINFSADKTIASGVELGSDGNALDTITIANGVDLSFTDSIYANHINVGTNGDSASSLNLTLSDGDTILGDTEIANLGILDITNSGNISSGAIDGKTDNAGILNLSGGGTLNLNGDIGDDFALSEINIGEYYSINAFTENASIIAANIYLSQGANINMSSGTLSATIHGNGVDDQVNFLSGTAHTLDGDLGVASDAAGINNITLQGLLDTDEYGVRANNFVLDSISTLLIIGSGNIDIGTFTNNNAGSGTIEFNASNNLDFAIDSDNEIAALNIGNGATLTVNQLVNASEITIGGGTSGKLILAAAQTLVGDVTINSGANLTLNNGSTVSGGIFGASSSGGGTLEIAASSSITASSDLGTSGNKLATILLNANSTLNLGNNDLVANSISLNNGATLQIDSGTITGQIFGSSNGFGSLIFTENNSLSQNIGTNSNKISSVAISDGKTLTSGANGIYANNVSLGNGATLELQNGSFVSNQINGASSGQGEIISSGTVSFGAIGSNFAVQDLTVSSGTATFGGNISASNSVNISGNAIFSNARTIISTDSFNVNSGSSLALTVNLMLNSSSILEVSGAAMISENTTLKLTISGGRPSGSSVVLVNAGSSSTLAEIADDKININNSNRNFYHGQTIFSSVEGDQLLITFMGDYVSAPDSDVFDVKIRNVYEAIMAPTDASGELLEIQSYMSSSPNPPIEEMAEVIKSITPQVDNSSNRIAFDSISTNANIISARLESVRNDSNSFDSGPAFNMNNIFNQSLNAQTMEPLRDGKIKSLIPSSISLPNDKNKSLWIQTFGSNVRQDSTKDGDGYHANSSGFSIGADYKIDTKNIIGISGGASQSNIKASVGNKNTSIQSYQFSVYGAYNDKNYFLNYTAGIALNDYNARRSISAANVSAKSQYHGQSYNARGEIGSNFKMQNDLIFTPSFMITAARNEVNDYDENGAGTLNLHVKNNASNFLEGRVAAELSKTFITKEKTNVRPQFIVSYGYDFLGNQQKTTSNFIGQTTNFTNDGAKVAQASLRIGTGIAFYTKEDVTLSLNYGFEHRNSFTSNSAWLRAGYKF